jgi:Fe2+ or Zn2+ uptake regulation protein
MKTAYTNLYEITELQQTIVKYITYWVTTEKTPIPRKEIIAEMKRRGKKSSTVVNALNGLLRLGYIRRAVITSNKTFYVQLRKV